MRSVIPLAVRGGLAALLAGVALVSILVVPGEAHGGRTYRDPDDAQGNLDAITISGERRVSSNDGLVFRTRLTMQDEWLDEDLEVEFSYRELGARLPRSCGDDCSGHYAGWLYYDPDEGRIRASGYEPVNCDCADMEWPAGRAGSRSVWFDIPESWLYPGTYAYEIEFTLMSQKQAEPAELPICLSGCSDAIRPLIFGTSTRH